MNRRKKILEISILVIMSSLIVTIIFFAFKQKRNQEMAIRHINDMPSFQFKKINGVSISDRDLVSVSQRIVINFFSPICDHCQNMATQYFKNKEQLKDVRILMITIADSISIAKFSNDYHLNILSNVILVRDTKFQFYKIFGTATVPSFFIYEHQKLVKEIIGETKIETLLN